MKDYLFETLPLLLSLICINWFFISVERFWIRLIVLLLGMVFAYIYTWGVMNPQKLKDLEVLK